MGGGGRGSGEVGQRGAAARRRRWWWGGEGGAAFRGAAGFLGEARRAPHARDAGGRIFLVTGRGGGSRIFA